MDVNGCLAENKAVGGVRFTTQLHLVSRFGNDEVQAYLNSITYPHRMVLISFRKKYTFP
jgi:hypothetical protein